MINPIMVREVITIFRRFRTYAVISIYLGLLIFAVYSNWPGVYRHYYGGHYGGGFSVFDIIEASRRSAAQIFYSIMMLMFILLPSYMATTFTREKEENTLASLMTTQLTITDIIIGKIQVGLFYTFYLLMITLPIFGALYKMGGFTLSELLQSYLIVLVVSNAVSLWAMFFSLVSGSSYKAISRTYIFFILMMFAFGFLTSIFWRSGLGNIIVSEFINPFVCIERIFVGKSYAYGSIYSARALSSAGGSDLVFGIFYWQTIKITVFYTLLSVLFTVVLRAIYRQLEHKWI